MSEMDDFFEALRRGFGSDKREPDTDPGRVRERAAARRGECPEARKCTTTEALAHWFECASMAARAIHRSAQ